MATGIREELLRGFFRLRDLDASDASGAADTFDRLRDGTLQGALVRNVLSAAELEPLVAKLERHDPPFLETWFPGPFRSWFYGRCLDLTHPVLTGYFAEAVKFREHLQALSTPSLPERIAPILAALDHGRPFQAPPGPDDGDIYMFSTLRGHLPGGFIPPHCENEQLERAPYRHLRTLVEPHVLSFVLALTAAEGGGALEVFDMRFDQVTPDQMRAGRTAVDDAVGARASVEFRLEPGTMIVVDGGRYLHRLTSVEGERVRWTVSSFMARSRRGARTYCWG